MYLFSNLHIKRILTLALLLILSSCAIRQGPYTLEEIEDIRIDFKKGKRKALVTLIDIYRDRNQPYDVRLESLRALAESRHPYIIEAIQSSVKNANLIEMEMMLEAINILVTYSSKKSTDSLVVSLKNTESKVMQIREAIVNAIGENGSEDEVVTLLELYEVSKANHARMNKLLTLSLGGLGDDRVIPILMDIARNKEMDIHIRSRAVEILSRKQTPELVDFFAEMLGDPTTRDKVNEFAYNVMGSDLNDEKMVFALLESYQLGKHQYYSLLNSLMKSIETYKNPEIKPMLIEVATTDGFPKAIRVKAIKSLLKFNDPEVARDLVTVLETPSNYIFYSEIIKMMKDLGVYETYKDEIRSSAFKAMKKDILN